MVGRKLASLAGLALAKVTGRRIVVLPAADSSLLPLRYTYRAGSDGTVSYHIQTPGGPLQYRLYTAEFSSDMRPVPGQVCLSCTLPAVREGDTLHVNLLEPGLRHNDRIVPATAAARYPARKFIADLELAGENGRLTRRCSHYLPFEHKQIDRDYYYGDDYVDYPAQQHYAVRAGVELVRRYCSGGRLLEVGCALGLYLQAFLDAGFDAYGIDVSEYAVTEASKRVGVERVQQCNVDTAPLPFDGVFDLFFLWDVLEHSAEPEQLLEKLTARAAPGAWLFIHTSNAESLTHRVLGGDWEAYTDYSHYGVDKVSASSVRAWLGRLGWQVEKWECSDIWVDGADPVIVRLGEVFRAYPELRVLLSERDLGDFVLAVARKL